MEVNIGRRVNHIRTEQAQETGASVVATGCPFCMQMFEDGIRSKGAEGTMRAQDIAELMAQSLPQPQAAQDQAAQDNGNPPDS
jgi:Fe-S oxidoreductase